MASRVVIALLLLYAIAIIAYFAFSKDAHNSNRFVGADGSEPAHASDSPWSPAPACAGSCAEPEKFTPTLYSSADYDDELITGELYQRGRLRSVYATRTSHGDEWGLQEYTDAGPGDVGYDVGPLGLDSNCTTQTSNDGIPENWNLPSTPLQFYAVVGGDYYGAEGPTPYCGAGLEMISVGDHRPLLN